MKRAHLLAFLRHLVRNIASVLNTFPSVRNMLHRLLHVKLHETQVLLLSGLVVGVGAGLGAVVFRELISGFTFLFFQVLRPTLSTLLGPYAIIFIPAIGGLLFGPMIYFFAREAKGHGVPEVMLAVVQKGGRIRPIVAAIKSVASAVCIGSGGSVGREGPIVQIGSALGSTWGQLFHMSDARIRTLVACGAAGGIAATFNAPIAGVFFALEIILGEFSTRSFGIVVIASVTASLIGRAFFGNVPSFPLPAYQVCWLHNTSVLKRDLFILAFRRGNSSFRLLDIPYMPWYTCCMAATPSTMLPLGTAAPPFALPDVVSGETISLETFVDRKALLVMFLCRHCKYVQHVKRALTSLGQEYQGTDLGIVAISANDAAAYAEDAPASLKAMAAGESFTFPFCYDETQAVAKAYTAACTPDFFLFDGQRKDARRFRSTICTIVLDIVEQRF